MAEEEYRGVESADPSRCFYREGGVARPDFVGVNRAHNPRQKNRRVSAEGGLPPLQKTEAPPCGVRTFL